MSNDPFAFLRSLVPGAASTSSDASGAVDSSPANSVESDLFSGSEPVPAEPENTPVVETAPAAIVVHSSDGITVASPPVIQGDILATIQAALLQLDDRLHVIEVLLRQDGRL